MSLFGLIAALLLAPLLAGVLVTSAFNALDRNERVRPTRAGAVWMLRELLAGGLPPPCERRERSAAGWRRCCLGGSGGVCGAYKAAAALWPLVLAEFGADCWCCGRVQLVSGQAPPLR